MDGRFYPALTYLVAVLFLLFPGLGLILLLAVFLPEVDSRKPPKA